jgi:nicotinate-nucleotide adenylyltransferase
MTSKPIVVFGGTFDPPHVGHLILAEYAREGLNAEHVLFVPAADPPHKQGDTRSLVRHRLAMLELVLAENPRFVLSLVDVERPGPHYTVDMIKILREQNPGAEFYFLLGADSLRDLPTWNRPRELIDLCRLAVMRRPDAEADPEALEAALPGISARVTVIDAPLLGISSSDIAERVRRGLSVRYLVPDAALDYILSNRLYREET